MQESYKRASAEQFITLNHSTDIGERNPRNSRGFRGVLARFRHFCGTMRNVYLVRRVNHADHWLKCE